MHLWNDVPIGKRHTGRRQTRATVVIQDLFSLKKTSLPQKIVWNQLKKSENLKYCQYKRSCFQEWTVPAVQILRSTQFPDKMDVSLQEKRQLGQHKQYSR